MEHKPDISNLRTRTHNDNKPSSNLAQRGIFYPVPSPFPRSLDLLNEKTKKKKKNKNTDTETQRKTNLHSSSVQDEVRRNVLKEA